MFNHHEAVIDLKKNKMNKLLTHFVISFWLSRPLDSSFLPRSKILSCKAANQKSEAPPIALHRIMLLTMLPTLKKLLEFTKQ